MMDIILLLDTIFDPFIFKYNVSYADHYKNFDFQSIDYDLKNIIPNNYHNIISGKDIFNYLYVVDMDYRFKYKFINSLIDNKITWPFEVNGANNEYATMYVLCWILEEPYKNTYFGKVKKEHQSLQFNIFKRFIEEYDANVNITDTVLYNNEHNITILELIDNITELYFDKLECDYNLLFSSCELKKYIEEI